MKSLGCLAVACAALALAGPAAPSRPNGRLVDIDFHSVATGGELRAAVYLPAGYDRTADRFPVVYFLHGLPAGPTSFDQIDFLRRAVDEGAARRSSSHRRVRSKATRGPGRRWETAIAREVPAYVDVHFRTIRSRRARAIVGLSAGGYGAALLAFHHLDRFSVVESWSGYFHPTDPDGTHALDLGSGQRNARASAHTFVTSLRRSFARRPTFFAFCVGRGDARFRSENERLNDELTSAHVAHVFNLYRGGHEQSLWNEHARAWLTLALQHLERPRR